jgi:hypothetical protein
LGTILKPRLDVAFKSTNPNAPRKPLEQSKFGPIRIHWQRFIEYYAEKHNLEVEEYLLTQITPKLAEQYESPFIPHRGRTDGFNNHCMFYMQTVFPEIFSVDKAGWGGDLSFLPVGTEGWTVDAFPRFQERIERNESFFPQFERTKLERRDIFFACQLPHDKNVVDQSTIGVHDALRRTLDFANQHGLRVRAKGHPVWGSAKYTGQCEWTDNSIHDCLESADIVVTVNSGVGLEAVLHEKPVYAFGRANYSEITAPSLADAFNWKPDYRGFFNNWYAAHEDYTQR